MGAHAQRRHGPSCTTSFTAYCIPVLTQHFFQTWGDFSSTLTASVTRGHPDYWKCGNPKGPGAPAQPWIGKVKSKGADLYKDYLWNSHLKLSEWQALTRDHIVLPATQHAYPPNTKGMSHPAFTPSRRASLHIGRYSFPVSQRRVGLGGWLHTRWYARSKTVTHPSTNRPIVRRPGIEPTTIESQVRRPNH